MSQFNNPKYQQLIDYLNNNVKSAWVGHSQIAMWLVNRYKPAILVDCGTDKSFSAACLASEGIGKVYTIDSFIGDQNAGFNISSLELVKNTYATLLKNKLLPIDNIQFVKGFFHDVKDMFADKSVDLIHLDGLHTIGAITQDFEDYFPKLTDNGIMLFHDVISFPDTVGKFFFGLPYPKTHLSNSAGLGILCRNQSIIDEINKMWVNRLYDYNSYLLKHHDHPEFNILKNF